MIKVAQYASEEGNPENLKKGMVVVFHPGNRLENGWLITDQGGTCLYSKSAGYVPGQTENFRKMQNWMTAASGRVVDIELKVL